MKKIALGILSVFMILGGVLLSACEKKVSLSVSSEEVIIYTNDEQAENYQSKEIDVFVENSNLGVNVEILKGQDCVTYSAPKLKGDGKYSFVIYANKSGSAEVKVSAVEDSSQNKIISVGVNTVLKDLQTKSNNNLRTDLFVVKGGTKELNVLDYFEFEPVTANICDVDWTFESSGSKEYVVDNQVRARIEDDKLYVSENFDVSYIDLKATFTKNTTVSNSVRFEVIERSTINSLKIEDVDLYKNNDIVANSANFELKRNNSNLSSVQGTLVVNTLYSVELEPVVYQKLGAGCKEISRAEFEKYFAFDITSDVKNEAEKKRTFTFQIDALDISNFNLLGQFYINLNISFKNYNYEIVTESDILIDVSYSATRIDLYNQENDSLNNAIVDVYSNYVTGNGFKIKTVVGPTDVAIDNEMFFISVDINQESLANLNLQGNISNIFKIYYRGDLLQFSPISTGSSVYVSNLIKSGSDLYVLSGTKYDMVEMVQLNFVSESSEIANTSMTMNLYKTSADAELSVTTEEGDDLPENTYLPSTSKDLRSLEYVVKIGGVSTLSGLSLEYSSNSKFNFSSLELLSSNVGGDEGNYVVVKFSVSLVGYDFTSQTKFWFEHVTGKKSNEFAISAFVPLQTASISNDDKSSADVFKDETISQNFVLSNGNISNDILKANSSLSKLMLEVGSSLMLKTDCKNATLSEEKISYKFLTFDNLVSAIRISQAITEDEAIELAENFFAVNDLSAVAQFYRFFGDVDTRYFEISDSKIRLADNEFKGYVCALFNGYDENHEQVTLVRFFALESFYSVKFLSSNVDAVLLYSEETLSIADIAKSRVDITISLRPDEKIATYSDKLSYFSFYSGTENEIKIGVANQTEIVTDYYTISNLSLSNGGKYFKFRITAKSTKLQTKIDDVIKVVYLDDNGFRKETAIQIQIKNENRVESVQWLNQTVDNEIYLNLTSSLNSERSFTISTSVSPSDANDIGLSYIYVATYGSANDLAVTTSQLGQTFNLNINTTTGGYGNLYLLPNDMIKIVDGVKQVLVYKYEEDADGKLIENVNYVKLSDWQLKYEQIINGSEEYSNYFFNNDGEKIYYSDIILRIGVTIADGNSEGTAIRVYSQADLQNVDTAKYYKVMNNITLNSWKAYKSFSGMLLGKNETVTLTFEGESENFVDTLSGTIKNLAFAGNVTANSVNNEYAGFIAGKNNGLIENCSIDVYYSNGNYCSSTLKSSSGNVGTFVGENYGTIRNSFAYGATIDATYSNFAGGIAGLNNGTIVGCGVEFYNFTLNDNTYTNKIDATIVGGIVGYGQTNGIIEKSYVYAYSLVSASHNYATVLQGDNVGIFMGTYVTSNSIKIVESFGFVGNLSVAYNSPNDSSTVRIENSYITYYDDVYKTKIYNGAGEQSLLSESDQPTNSNSVTWNDLVANLDSQVWETENIDSQNNFGFMYLKNVVQSTAVDTQSLAVQDVVSPLKSLKVGDDKGILFVYSPVSTVSNSTEKAILDSYNTISVADLFGVSTKQAKSLVLTSSSKNVSISTNSIKLLNRTTTEFEIKVHSKMDFTKYKTFNFIILYNLPDLKTTIDGVELKDNQTVLVQTGKTRTITYNLTNSIYLGNSDAYALKKENFSVKYETENQDNFNVSNSNNSLILQGVEASENLILLNSWLVVDELEDTNYLNEIKTERSRNFGVSVYNGATALSINNATSLVVKPSQYATFEVTMKTDNENDNLVIGLKNGEIDITSYNEENSATFDVDEELSLQISWVKKQQSTSIYTFTVLVKIAEEKRHLVEKDYDNLSIEVNALSQQLNNNYLKTISLNVKTQELEDLSITTYNIESRQIRNSILYLTPKNEITNVLSPSSDAIVAVSVSPAYALMTHFTLTYQTSENASVGTVSISRLSYNSLFGYYADSKSTTLLTNGIRVNLSENDKKSNGVYYFRIYISSAFASTSELKLIATYYNGQNEILSGTHNITIDYLASASVKVNGSSTYVLAKGETAEVKVTVGLDQTLYELYLQNNGKNILLSATTEPEVFSTYKVYTATITAQVDATLEGDKENGIFYVVASVARMINNRQEIKRSSATICLVDFTIDANAISVNSSGSTRTYNGKTYDVFQSYISDTANLVFDYPMTPQTYNYDPNDASQLQAVEKLISQRNEFQLKNNYKDEDVGYYINYEFDEETNSHNELTLKQQLWYCSSESSSTMAWNAKYEQFIQNDYFNISENEQTGYITISGKRSGVQLMKLQTIVEYEGIEFVYDYYFLIVVEVWTDEDAPTPILTGEEFVDFATKSAEADDYILMNDIVLNDYTPVDTDLIKSLDGNGYTIHLNSFAMPTESTLNLALFNEISSLTTLKNVRVNIYSSGHIDVDITQYQTINIAGFAITNNGIVYNCEVVSYYDDEYQKGTIAGESGLIVNYTQGKGTDPIQLSQSMVNSLGIESKVSGFVIENNSSLMNSRVGGEEFRHIVKIAGTNYVSTQLLDTFVIQGQGEVSGFANTNDSNGYISACYAKSVQINNNMNSTLSVSAGFVVSNLNNIQNSYVTGEENESDEIIYNNNSNISSLGKIAGFVYENSKLVKNCYANIAIENSNTKGSMVAGFVYKNNQSAEVLLSFSACEIARYDIDQMQFSGVDEYANSLNEGKIETCYFYNESKLDTTSESKLTSGVISVSSVQEDIFYGFSFSSQEESYDGIWRMNGKGVSLVSADRIALSNRYYVSNGVVINYFYSKNILDAESMIALDLSYGSVNNPIIIRNAKEFAMATGKATTTEVSSYKEYYSDTKVFGNYRIVSDIDMSEIDQNSENANSVKLTTTKKTFSGILDGNGFTISNINLGSSVATENFGLFEKLDQSVVMNIDFIVDSIHNTQANIVGTLAGTAIDTRIMGITLSPVTTENNSDNTAVHGNNIVGGVVGMLFGKSKLSDITIKDIDIYSAYYSALKNVGSNDENLSRIRAQVKTAGGLRQLVENLSYAGAVAGYVDIYDDINSEYVKFSINNQVNDFDIVTVRVEDSVNIYGEVAGGLFGYVGKSTMIYDASITLDADMNLSKPSYITSKNLYAGGLIGENYGGMFAVSAKYSNSLQGIIEENEYKYYNGNLSAEKGQQSIFSYTPNDAGYISNVNDPLFVGGLVGYMGGGYIYVGYNKLNVISHSNKTEAVGGIIGLVGQTENEYSLSYVSKTPKTCVLLQDVYASGDVYVDGENGVASGIIGAIEAKNSKMSKIALKNVLAVNYYSYNGSQLVGDIEPIDYTSDRHKVLVGKIYGGNSLIDNFLLLDSDNGYLNVKDGTEVALITGSSTVGGYRSVIVGNTELKLDLFGFKASGNLNNRTLTTKSIGDSTMDSMSGAYSEMKRYFLLNKWSDLYWVHTSEQLFPHIELLPKINVVYWDVENTSDVLSIMQEENPSVTIVVRGKISKEDAIYQDIDLRDLMSEQTWNTIKNFKGHLVSYRHYMNNDEEGIVSEGYEITDGNCLIGGKAGDDVGLIISDSLFENLNSGAVIEYLNIYFAKPIENESEAQRSSSDEFVTNSFVKGIADYTIFRNLNIVLDQSIVIETSEVSVGGKTIYSAGLLSRVALTSSFMDINVTSRSELVEEEGVKKFNDSTITLRNKNTEKDVYMGLFAGIIQQDSSYTQISVQGLTFARESNLDGKTFVSAPSQDSETNFETVSNYKNLYAGLYSGIICKKDTSQANINLGLSDFNNLSINISECTVSSSNEVQTLADDSAETSDNDYLYFGTFVGKVDGVYNISFMKVENTNNQKGVTINQNISVENLKMGLCFGELSNAYFSSKEVKSASLVGKIYQVEDKTTKLAKIGGIAGSVTSNISVQNVSVNLTIATVKSATQETETTMSFDSNEYDYSEILSPYVIIGSDADCSVGGYFGYVNGSKIVVQGSASLKGKFDLQIGDGTTVSALTDNNRYLSVGGLVGKTVGEFEISESVNNKIDISVKQGSPSISANAYVGGAIGWVYIFVPEGNSEKVVAGTKALSNITYTGNVLSNVADLTFGGAIGYASADYTNGDKYTEKNLDISSVVFGGAVKIYGDRIENGKVCVGGVVGSFDKDVDDASPSSNIVISNCKTYGDVFVMYKNGDNTNNKLSAYNFGGIVGCATYMTIKDCNTIMTNFNNRLVNSDSGVGNVGAIVGKNSGLVTYGEIKGNEISHENNYSSGVCMAYQEESGNRDMSYGETNANYVGYTNTVGEAGQDKSNEVKKGGNILDVFNGRNLDKGHKLNPFVVNKDNQSIEQAIENGKIAGSLNGIKWTALSAGLTEITEVVADKLTNTVFVGNGLTLSVKDSRSGTDKEITTAFAGGLVNELGVEYNANITDNSFANADRNKPNFSVVSSVVLQMNVNADFASASSAVRYYGAVAGRMQGNSFVYGVGVEGEISVGGNVQLNLAGAVGHLEYGFINQCYVDADIVYRGNEDGVVSGVASVGDYNSTIMATYSSGKIETYVDVEVYTFANSTKNISSVGGGTINDKTTNDIYDCYSITSVSKANVLNDNPIFKGIYLINADEETIEDTKVTKISGVNNVVNGCYDLTDYKKADDMSLSYASDVRRAWNSVLAPTKNEGENQDSETEGYTTYTTWYFNPYVNYGYASHGFGYLKNVTTYLRRDLSAQSDESETTETASTETSSEYKYSRISYADVLKEDFGKKDEGENATHSWFLGVLNAGKFGQMIDSCKETTNPYKFVLRYGLDMSKTESKLGNSIGNENFELDGKGNTLDFANVTGLEKGLFDILTGNVSNLRLVNVNISSSSENAGALANEMTGDLKNVTVIGNLSTSGTGYVGGVVGVLNGNATSVQATVNVTTSKSHTIGGIVGKLESGTINYSTNSGMIINNSNSGAIHTVSILKGNEVVGSSTAFVAGGIVGYAGSGTTISNSYNANAVLANFSSKNNTNSVAGGIVGYAGDSTISNCFNTGFVGAGNYNCTKSGAASVSKGNGCSFAGGIFAYASNVNVSGCVNDGAVQAISYQDNDYKITVSKKSGDDSTGYKNKPDSLKFEYTITYNPGDNRAVYAYGIGFALEGTFGTDNYTSLDNIKNDGNIGECSDIQTLTFDRQAILDNDEGALNFYGKFALQKLSEDSTKSISANSDIIEVPGDGSEGGSTAKDYSPYYEINGYDSYGMPARVYMIDKITRSYGNPNSSSLNEVNDISKTVITTKTDWSNDEWPIGQYYAIYNRTKNANGEWIYNGGEQYNTNDYNAWNYDEQWKQWFKISDFTLEQSTTYSSSAKFVRYDEMLNDAEGKYIGLVGYCHSYTNKIISNTNVVAIEDKIKEINNFNSLEGQIKNLTVAGEKNVAKVSSGSNLKAAISPYSAEFEFSMTLEGADPDKLNDITRDNVHISGNDLQFYTIDSLSVNESVVSFTVTGYFSGNGEKSLTASVSYTKTGEVTLSRKNVVAYSGGVYFILQDDEGNIVDDEIIDAILKNNGKSTTDDSVVYSYKIKFDNSTLPNKTDDIENLGLVKKVEGNITPSELSDYEGAVYFNYVTDKYADEEFANLNGKTLTFELTVTTTSTETTEVAISTMTASGTINASSGLDSELETCELKGYETNTFVGYFGEKTASTYDYYYFETKDENVVAGKMYYIRSGNETSGYIYSQVTNPIVSDISTYYECKALQKVEYEISKLNEKEYVAIVNGNIVLNYVANDDDTKSWKFYTNDSISEESSITENGFEFSISTSTENDVTKTFLTISETAEAEETIKDFVDGFNIYYKKTELKYNGTLWITKLEPGNINGVEFEVTKTIEEIENFGTDGTFNGDYSAFLNLNESEDGVGVTNITDITFGTLTFRSIDLTYKYLPTSIEFTNTVGKNFGYSAVEKDIDANKLSIYQGFLEADSSFDITLNSVTTSVDFSYTCSSISENDTSINDNYKFENVSIILTPSDVTDNSEIYTISTGSQQSPEDTGLKLNGSDFKLFSGAFESPISYVNTSYIKNISSETSEGYNYTIYSDGTIAVNIVKENVTYYITTELQKDKKMIVQTVNENEVENPSGNPSEQGWYEVVTSEYYVKTTDTEVVEGKTYYYLNENSEYEMVSNQTGNPSEEGYYEKSTVTQKQLTSDTSVQEGKIYYSRSVTYSMEDLDLAKFDNNDIKVIASFLGDTSGKSGKRVDEVYFVKNTAGNLKTNMLKDFKNTKPYENTTTLSTSSTFVPSEELGESYKGNFEVLEDGVWESADGISNTSYTSKTYNYRYLTTKEESVSADDKSEENIRKADIILVEGDLKVGVNFTDNTQRIIGNNGSISFVASNKSNVALFAGENSSNIENIAIISINSLRNWFNVSQAILATTNTGDLSCVSVYGNIRNINASSGAEISPVTTENSGNIKNINSYVSISGLNSARSYSVITNDVKVVLKDSIEKYDSSYFKTQDTKVQSEKTYYTKSGDVFTKANLGTEADINGEYYEKVYSESTYTSKNLLIAGDGGNGKDGSDGISSMAGKDAGSGGSGGKIEVENDTFKGIARAGIAGMPGMGGNGKNGYFYNAQSISSRAIIIDGPSNDVSSSSRALGGGKAGKAGIVGNDGSVKDGETKVENTLSIRVRMKDSDDNDLTYNYNGNSGIGGFGRIVNNTYYTSGKSGTLENNGLNGSVKDWKYERTNTGMILFGAAVYDNSKISSSGNMAESGGVKANINKLIDDWHTKVNNKLKDTTLYYSQQVRLRYWITIVWNWNQCTANYQIVWKNDRYFNGTDTGLENQTYNFVVGGARTV